MPDQTETVAQLRAAGLETRVTLCGPAGAPEVLLLHGGGIDNAAMSWAEMRGYLDGRFRLIAPDLPGYGGSEGFGGPHRVADLGAWAAEVMAATAAGPVAVAGCSMGGATALWLALERPDLVRAVAPLASYGLARRSLVQPAVALWPRTGGGRLVPRLAAGSRAGGRAVHSMIFANPRRISGKMVSDFQKEAASQARRHSFSDFLRGEAHAGQFETCFLDRLPDLSVPALFIHGRFDTLVGFRHARRAAAVTPEGQLLPVLAGHWPQRERPEIVGPALRDFLERPIP